MQGQLVAALNKVAALDLEPPQVIVRSLADLQAFAENMQQRWQHLEEQSIAAHRCTAGSNPNCVLKPVSLS